MKRNITVKTIFDVEGQVDTIDVSAECEYIYSVEKQTISYDESTEDGVVPTVIKVAENAVDIIRNHPEMPDMHMKKGEKVSAEIQTPYGNIPITTTTEIVDIRLDENGGTISLEYVIDIGGADSRNCVSITIS